MLSRPNIWPQSVNELIPNTLFKLASRYPDLTYAEYSRTNNAADGNRKITFKEVANAAHAVAWWIEKHVGKPAKDDGSETLVYMGPNDLRYGLLIFGSVLVGYKVINAFACCWFVADLMCRCFSQPRATVQNLSQHSSHVSIVQSC